MTALVLAIGLFRGPEDLLAGGEAEPDAEPAPDPLAGVARVEVVALIGIGATAAVGLIISWEWW